jgi:DNA helicase-2/ATP-dependent DNA helicase PcrA
MAFIHIFEYAKNVGAALAKDIFLSLNHFGDGSLIKGILEPTKTELPKLNKTVNKQLGLFDDNSEIGLASRFAFMGFSKEIITHPIVKLPRLEKDALRFFENFYNVIKETQNLTNPALIVDKIINSKLYDYLIELLSTQRGKLKSGEIDQNKKDESKKRIIYKSKMLLELSKPYNNLQHFLNAMILGGGELSEGEGVNLLTVHASKGLEFEEVYLVDLADGRFPNRKLMNKNGGIDEERRLFYVAVTRAKSKLFLSFAKYDKIKKQEYMPSPFLYEAKLLKRKENKI